MERYDLVVVGGGFSGVCASIASARRGLKVLLIEKGNALGGASVHSLVNPFMPYSTKINGKEAVLCGGIFSEIVLHLKERGDSDGYSFLEEGLKLILNEMVLESGAKLLFHSYLCGAQAQDGKITSVSVATRSGVIDISADYFIDATADATLTFLAGFPTTLGRESDSLCQPMTLCFRLGNVDVERFFASWERLKTAHRVALESGELINPRENILVFKMPAEGVLHFNTTRVIKKNPTSPHELTEAEIIARRQVDEIYTLMKKHADGLENSFLMMTGAEIGIRESRQIVGEYTLKESDLRTFRKFDDAISSCNYDIDIHNPEGTGTSHYYFPEGEYYTIPYRSLIPRGSKNMLAVGRCISSDHESQASYRIMPTVASIGEAGGTAISLVQKSRTCVSEVDIKSLQNALKQNGAFIGI